MPSINPFRRDSNVRSGTSSRAANETGDLASQSRSSGDAQQASGTTSRRSRIFSGIGSLLASSGGSEFVEQSFSNEQYPSQQNTGRIANSSLNAKNSIGTSGTKKQQKKAKEYKKEIEKLDDIRKNEGEKAFKENRQDILARAEEDVEQSEITQQDYINIANCMALLHQD